MQRAPFAGVCVVALQPMHTAQKYNFTTHLNTSLRFGLFICGLKTPEDGVDVENAEGRTRLKIWKKQARDSLAVNQKTTWRQSNVKMSIDRTLQSSERQRERKKIAET